MIDPQIAGYIDVDGGRVWYRSNAPKVANKANTTIIAIHGGPGGHHRRLMPLTQLANERQVILYDQLECGNSDHPNDESLWTVERYTNEIKKIVDYFELSDFVLFGHSMGGGYALKYMELSSIRPKALILSSPLVNTLHWVEDNDSLVSELDYDTKEVIRLSKSLQNFNNQNFSDAIDVYEKHHYCRHEIVYPDVMIDAPEFNTMLYEKMWGPTEFICNGSLKEFDCVDILPEIDIPTLFIGGEFDSSTPTRLKSYAKEIKDAKVVTINDVAHCGYLEKPFIYINSIREFLYKNNL